jgi:hypothetical protein
MFCQYIFGGAHASGSLHIPVSKVLSGMWGTARAAQRGSLSRGALLPGTWGTARAAQRGARPGEHGPILVL